MESYSKQFHRAPKYGRGRTCDSRRSTFEITFGFRSTLTCFSAARRQIQICDEEHDGWSLVYHRQSRFGFRVTSFLGRNNPDVQCITLTL